MSLRITAYPPGRLPERDVGRGLPLRSWNRADPQAFWSGEPRNEGEPALALDVLRDAASRRQSQPRLSASLQEAIEP